MFDVGTCSLHVVHVAYKTAHNKTGWNIHEFLRALFYLFKDFPSRRAQYTQHSRSTTFPLKFCAIRWIENSRVISRALEIILSVKKYTNAVADNPPATQNFIKVKYALQDKLLVSKLEFLLSFALELEFFLTMFQSNNALLPFMYKELYLVLHSIACRFIKKSVMDNVRNPPNLMDIDVSKPSVLKSNPEIEIGFGAKAACKGLGELSVLSFKSECKDYFQSLYLNLILKCPLKLKIVKGASCLSPDVMTNNTLRVSRVTAALEEFVLKKHMSPSVADGVKRDYLHLCTIPTVVEEIRKFKWRKEKLDVLLMQIVKDEGITNNNMVIFFQQLLMMFHGNSSVERGFSINKECLVENLTDESLIAQRSVYSAVSTVGKVTEVLISKPMILASRNASSKRQEALKAKKSEISNKVHAVKRAAQEMKELIIQKKRLISQRDEEVAVLDKEISSLRKNCTTVS